MTVETRLVVLHLDSDIEASLQMPVKVYQVRIDVVQQGAVWSQPQRYSKAAAKRLYIRLGFMGFPQVGQARHQPSLSSRPLQRWLQRCVGIFGLRGSCNQLVGSNRN